MDDLPVVQAAHVRALVDFVDQVSMDTVESLVQLLAASPALAASTAATLLASCWYYAHVSAGSARNREAPWAQEGFVGVVRFSLATRDANGPRTTAKVETTSPQSTSDTTLGNFFLRELGPRVARVAEIATGSRLSRPCRPRGQTRALMRDLLLGIWEAEKKTVLFVTHGIDEAFFMGLSISQAKLQPLKL